MENRLHVCVGCIEGTLVEAQIVLIVLTDTLLVEDAKHLVKPVVDLAVQAGYLHDDAVVVQAVDKLVGNTTCNWTVVVVVCLMANVDDGLLYIPHGVAQQIDGHHGQGMTVSAAGDNVLRVLIVNT